jgi:hypothetical protein
MMFFPGKISVSNEREVKEMKKPVDWDCIDDNWDCPYYADGGCMLRNPWRDCPEQGFMDEDEEED